MLRCTTLVCWLLVLCSMDWYAPAGVTRGSSGQARPAFGAQANYVEIDAIVTDRSGGFVRGLNRDDFEVFENGRKQDLIVFSLIDQGVDPSGQEPVRPFRAPDVATNSSTSDGRVFLLVLDSFHVDPLRTPQLRRRASEFVARHVQPADRVAVAHIGYPVFNQEFTSNKALLLASIAKFIGEKPTSAAVARANADPNVTATGARRDREERVRPYLAIRSVHALAELSTYVGRIGRERKAIVFFSEGFDLDYGEHPDFFDEVRAMFASAARSNVSIYTVDPRALATIDELIQVGGIVEGSTPPTRALYNELTTEQNSLRNLAEETGGVAAVASSDVSAAFRRIVEDNSRYYLLGYNTADTSTTKFRSLTVRVTRSDLQVRARKGYSFGSHRPDAPNNDLLADLLTRPVASDGLTLRLATAAFMSTRRMARVQVLLDVAGEELTFENIDGAFVNDVSVSYHIIDSDGQVRVRRREVLKLRLQSPVYEAVKSAGLRYTAEFEVVPGRYQFRVAAQERTGTRVGSVYADLEVNDFTKPVAMSGMLLSARNATPMPGARGVDTRGRRLPGQATTLREFASAETLFALVEITDNGPVSSPGLEIATTVVSSEGIEVWQRLERRAFAKQQDFIATIPLKEVLPGVYRLTVEARRSHDSKSTATRSVEFRVK